MSYYHCRTNSTWDRAVYPIEVSLVKDQVSLTSDTLVAPYSKRGYWVEKRGPTQREHGSCLSHINDSVSWPDHSTTHVVVREPLPLRQPWLSVLLRQVLWEFAAEHWTSLDPSRQVYSRRDRKPKFKPNQMSWWTQLAIGPPYGWNC